MKSRSNAKRGKSPMPSRAVKPSYEEPMRPVKPNSNSDKGKAKKEMNLLQLNPGIPVSCPKGNGVAWVLIDYGMEFNLYWVIAIDETGEIWTYENPNVRALKNITYGRLSNGKEKNGNKEGHEENGKRHDEKGS